MKFRRLVTRESTLQLAFFDLSKAFDRVWHQGLMAKLKHYGVQEAALRWFSAYLIGRRQRVRVEGTTSAFLPILARVLQGSVLATLLFLVCTVTIDGSAAHCELQCVYVCVCGGGGGLWVCGCVGVCMCVYMCKA